MNNTVKNQGYKPDPTGKLGLKFDSKKSRIDLIDINSMCSLINLDDSNISASELYSNILFNISYNDEGLINNSNDIISNIKDIASSCIKLLDIKDNLDLIVMVGDMYSHGAEKYGINNWKKVAPERFVAALGRHIHKIINGKVYDSDSGFKHALHAYWNCIAIIHFIKI